MGNSERQGTSRFEAMFEGMKARMRGKGKRATCIRPLPVGAVVTGPMTKHFGPGNPYLAPA